MVFEHGNSQQNRGCVFLPCDSTIYCVTEKTLYVQNNVAGSKSCQYLVATYGWHRDKFCMPLTYKTPTGQLPLLAFTLSACLFGYFQGMRLIKSCDFLGRFGSTWSSSQENVVPLCTAADL